MKSPCKAVKDIGVILKKNVKDIGAMPNNRFAKNVSKVVGNNFGLEILVQFDRDQLV